MPAARGKRAVRLEGDSLVVEGPLSLSGVLRPRGDKSVSHRALLFAALAPGTSRISNLGSGGDVGSTLQMIRALGVAAELSLEGAVAVEGPGPENFSEPRHVIDCGNSATTMRLGCGLMAGLPYLSVLTGDASLRRRPMGRLVDPLRRMGATIATSPGDIAPLMVKGGRLRAIEYELPIPSAQLKGAILIAGLCAEGRTVVSERFASREHTETMLEALGASIEVRPGRISIAPSRLHPFEVRIPGDISSAAFFLVGATLLEGSEVRAEKVLLSPVRRKYLDVIASMGARVSYAEEGYELGQPYGYAATSYAGPLTSVEIGPPLVPALIDELVVLAAAACLAEGTTRISGAAELRGKETDRITDLACELRKTGARIEELPDGLVIEGLGASPRPANYDSHGDHRIAMATAILACAARGRSTVRGIEDSAISYPGFISDFVRLTDSQAPVVAIDGPAGSGKSTVAKKVASRLGLRYLDTGAMYRALTLAALREGIPPSDIRRLARLAAEIDIEISGDGKVFVNGADVTGEIRTREVDRAVSLYSAVPEVRRELVDKQRRYASDGAVVEGRDIGSVVFPDARVRIFLSASAEERARRRHKVDTDRTLEELTEDIQERDRLDATRATSPLKPAEGAHLIDTTEMAPEEVADCIVDLWTAGGFEE